MKRDHPNVMRASEIAHPAAWVDLGGRWAPARPASCPTIWERLHAAWLVFTGRADAVIWEGQ
jgi:hypothetical protein